MTITNELIETAVAAAIDAGRQVMEVYGTESFSVETKADTSPLTEADTRSHTVIAQQLASATPEIPVLSEEGIHLPFADRRHWRTLWIVDPLDGTKEFIRRNDEFTVNIALIARNTGEDTPSPVLGVVYAPALGTLYLGVQGRGAWRLPWPVDAQGTPSATRIIAEATGLPQKAARRPYTIVASRSHMSPETAAFIEKRRREYPDLDLITAGSSLKICKVAEGSAAEYPRFAPTMEWDTAAGDAVARAAGCEVMQWDPTQNAPAGPLSYNKEDLHNPWFLVCRERKHETK
jgi:3'(2'), 5'-bisphosphate nucleotidase